MKKTESEPNDELRPEYDLRSLRVRKLGPGRKSFSGTVALDPDVAAVFPDADSILQTYGAKRAKNNSCSRQRRTA